MSVSCKDVPASFDHAPKVSTLAGTIVKHEGRDLTSPSDPEYELAINQRRWRRHVIRTIDVMWNFDTDPLIQYCHTTSKAFLIKLVVSNPKHTAFFAWNFLCNGNTAYCYNRLLWQRCLTRKSTTFEKKLLDECSYRHGTRSSRRILMWDLNNKHHSCLCCCCKWNGL